MMAQQLYLLVVFVGILGLSFGLDDDTTFLYGKFDDNFMWSTSTSAYQIEGGWNASGKGENIWDAWCHGGGWVKDGDTGDVACDSYNKFNEDVRILKEIGIPYYRFSISWARIMPNGTKPVNQAGIDYYNNVINAVKAAGIEPMVTLYHWDLPSALQDIGGWENEALVQYFLDYAKTAFDSFGDKVKLWMTFNEPFVVCWLGYGNGIFAPGIKRPGDAPYKCSRTILLAHAEAYRLYADNYKPSQNGLISISLDTDWKEARDVDDPTSVAAAERAMQFKLGWFANPIFGSGGYPPSMVERVANKSAAQGYNKSRLPEFTEEEKTRMKGTWDYFGLNHYTTQLITHCDKPLDQPSYENDQDHCEHRDPTWPDSGSDWLKPVPWGLRRLLNWIKNEYNNPPVFVTENGVSDNDGTLQDQSRSDFYRDYINNVLKANKTDGCNTIGYTAWSLMDNFEWTSGYSQKFGMTHVDFTKPDRPRTVKDSGRYFGKLITDNGFVDPDTSGCGFVCCNVYYMFLFVVITWFYRYFG